MQIDPADYIEAPEGVTTLRFNNEKQQAKFELGVCMAVYKWDELNTAVENSWGGPNSAEKRDWISGVVIDLFEENLVDVQLIEESLLYAMVDEFDTEIDNDSALEIAALVVKIYREIHLGQTATVDTMYEKFQAKQASRSSAAPVVIASDPNNPSDDDDDEDEEDEGQQAPALVQDDSMQVDDEPQGPIVDEDGFETVQRKGRRGGRR
ncbi:pre-rRNA-processing protein Tsr2p [[Candida] anglica]|uniref:Pre-rRNA-processing protein Tsr2p n=1 Tax=[Candida] anglica TaxID=148631 RepID=A0ABP0EA95_9ASCO